MTRASNSRVKPLPGGAQGTDTCLTPQWSHLTRGQLRGQPGFVLEEVQVPPALFRGVVCLEVCLAALRTDKDAAPGKGQTNVQALLLCGKLAVLHLPRRSQTRGHLEQVGVTHG